MLLSLAFIASCGGAEPESKAPKADAAAKPAPAEKPAPKPEPKPEPEVKAEIVVDDGTVVTINLTASDAMQYNTTRLKSSRAAP